jgi:hypothetical protein
MLAKNTSAASGYWRAVTSSSTPPRIVLSVPCHFLLAGKESLAAEQNLVFSNT